ncbi:protein kinase [Sedimentibacter sp. zth1]|uniref:protein kinase domain-containing protein n=1 Tax=Sedimentibacter sp. zth1 TaxID=2816908 RepID=UPI001A92723C|nr:protein kinase [Sedimentibacter sp. zth1]QSX06857.1 protein kinase [Sedimentibacter sp. zth1]
MIGRVLGNRYEIIEKIGGGGMSVVYKAKCRVLNRYVAIKILRSELISDSSFVEKFKQESLSAASLNHSNIVNIYDTGIEDNIYYIVMEYIKGETLKDLINRKGHLSETETIKISKQITEALKHAHANNIIHRDIKPHNILITEEGIAKVADFGIARAATTSTINNTSNVIGSVHYFSPEQARGGYVDEKSDIYSLGVVMYEMITGVVPFDADNHISVAMKHIQEEVVPPSKKLKGIKISEEFEQIILKCLQKHQSYRYQNASELLQVLYLIHSNKIEEIGTVNNKYLDELDSPTIILPKLHSKILNHNEEMSEDNENGNQNSEKNGSIDSKQEAFNNFFDNDNNKTKIIIEKDIDNDGNKEKINIKDKNKQKTKKSKNKKSKGRKSEEPLSKVDNFKTTLAAILLAIAVVSVIGFFVIKALIIVPEVTVPNFVGVSEEEARDMATKAGLLFSVQEREFNSEYDEGEIYDQSEQKGSKVKKNFPVEVSISKGIKEVEVPNILGKYSIEATTIIVDFDLEKGNITSDYSDTVPAGKIISQYPIANEKVEAGSKVDFVLSKGPETVYSIVPSVLGINVESAKSTIIANNLSVGEVTYENSNEYEANIVINQSYPAAKEVEEQTSINLVVSLGKAETPKPEEEEDEDNAGSEGEDGGEGGENPSNPEEPVVETQSQINVPLPKDKETVTLLVYKETIFGNEEVFNEEVSTKDGSYLLTVVGKGTENFQIYVDGNILYSENGEDYIEVIFN